MDLITAIKERRWQANNAWQPFYAVLWRTYNVYRFLRYPDYRSRILSTVRYRTDYHQFSSLTCPDRYPDLFGIARDYFRNYEHPSLLSFGCSTGEEVATLATYVPHATIVGTDINDWCVKTATQTFGSDSLRFCHSLSSEFGQLTGFDAIFCLAVFQHPANRHDRERQVSAYPFSKFESQLKSLSDKLNAGGLLFIDQCDFNFLETELMKNYRLAPVANNAMLRQRPLFNRKNAKIAEQQSNFRVFQKK